MTVPIIISLEGYELSKEEIILFNKIDPVGFILFERNILNKQQLKKLVTSLKEIGKYKKLILIDQEGGKVSRLKKPEWREMPSNYFFGQIYDKDPRIAVNLLTLNIKLLSNDLYQLGINVNCGPVLDLFISNSNKVIGSRSFHSNPNIVCKLAEVYCKILIEGSILPVIKHIPGQGRGDEDSHKKLPTVKSNIYVLNNSDFLPFKRLSDQPIAMTGHVLYSQLDKLYPGTISSTIINNIIRDKLNFNGLLITDDISRNMKALGNNEVKNANDALNAGCDIILHCSGNIESVKKISKTLPLISDISLSRLTKAFNIIKKPYKFNYKDTLIEYKDTLKYVKNIIN